MFCLIDLIIKRITNTENKESRIHKLQYQVKAGTIRFAKKRKLLPEQMRYFPRGKFDDGPDALEMAFRIVKNREVKVYLARETYNDRFPLK
ncbi:MAG: hypothetical protein PHN49_03680 [Candidatus Omnitrophica bacterium]|nr:hypothetical protein [Candidatus Omnitrophota bacterium]MDD5670719.1 hypothetical protein [Candidatus Omnitrophota bacterium]